MLLISDCEREAVERRMEEIAVQIDDFAIKRDLTDREQDDMANLIEEWLADYRKLKS